VGEVVQDIHFVPVPADLPPGSYRLVVGWYDRQNETRLGQEQFLGLVEVDS
jgi:hypothetical protein